MIAQAAHAALTADPLWPLWWAFALALGASLGSFVAATAYRLRSDAQLQGMRSCCEHCLRPLRPWENIPLVSFLLLRGRCRRCGGRIRPLDFALELGFACALPLVVVHLGPGLDAWRALVALPILTVGALVDLHERRLPLSVTRALLFAGLLLVDPARVFPLQGIAAAGLTLLIIEMDEPARRPLAWLGAGLSLLALGTTSLFLLHCNTALLAVGALLLIDRLYCRLRRVPVAIGGGDVRLVAGIAAFTGPLGIAPAVFVGAALGSIVGLSLVVLRRGTLSSQLPFGPFLGVGAMVVLLSGPQLGGLFPAIS